MLDVIAPLVVSNRTKIVLVSLDGLAGLPHPGTGRSELETARMPNLSALAARAECGLVRHVGPGISPGSAPGHLGLLGYDPLRFAIGRGVLEAVGIDVKLQAGDVAARGNFCSIDGRSGAIIDRRAGRITTEVCRRLTQRVASIPLAGAQAFVEVLKEHRFVVVFRGPGLSARLSETDPQAVGRVPLLVRALASEAARTAELVNGFIAEARRRLADEPAANMILLRGFDSLPELPRFPDVFGLRAAGIARYTLRGLAQLLGLDPLEAGATFADEVASLREHWHAYDFFFVHYEDTDKPGEDGNFDAKVAALERFDAFVPALESLGPDVLVITGDHSTPSVLKAHGWQPVPVLVASRYSQGDPVTAFTERACLGGSLGILPAQHLMPIVMAHAGRLTKFGA